MVALSRLEQLYRHVILDHSNHPRHKGFSKMQPNQVIEMNNPTCGDVIELQVFINDEQRIFDVRFEGQGCSISMASASMMCEVMIGKSVAQAEQLVREFSELIQGKAITNEQLQDALLLAGVSKFPARMKCATLAWKALERALQQEEKVVKK